MMQDPQNRSKSYKNQALKLLKKEFATLSVAAISATFAQKGHEFSDTFRCLAEIDAAAVGDNDEEILERLQEQYAFLERVSQLRIKQPRVVPRFTVSNETLQAEVDRIPVLNQKENQPPALIHENDDDEKEDGKRPAVPDVTCGCCFGDFQHHDIIQCSNGHSFCCDCLQQYIQEQFFGKNCIDFECIDSSGDRCPGFFLRHGGLDKLPAKLLESIDARIAIVEVKKAGCVVVNCPKCEFCGFVEDANISVVACTECSYVFCHLCQEPPHKGKSCEDAKAAKKEAAVNTAAEAMTAAVVRHCPRCKLACFKQEGCNKMTCPNQNCVSARGMGRTLFCYLCRQEVMGYEHFCRAPHCDHKSCNKCILFTKTEEDDRRARREAGLQHAEMAGNEGEAVALLLSPQQREKLKAKGNNKNRVLPQQHAFRQDPPVPPRHRNDDRVQQEMMIVGGHAIPLPVRVVRWPPHSPDEERMLEHRMQRMLIERRDDRHDLVGQDRVQPEVPAEGRPLMYLAPRSPLPRRGWHNYVPTPPPVRRHDVIDYRDRIVGFGAADAPNRDVGEMAQQNDADQEHDAEPANGNHLCVIS